MEHALDTIYRQHSQGYQHDYQADYQILDVDMSGLPCGPKAAFATKGYFAKQRNRRGRQLGRVLASRYQEVVVDRRLALDLVGAPGARVDRATALGAGGSSGGAAGVRHLLRSTRRRRRNLLQG